MLLYMASGRNPPLIPWDRAAPAFSVTQPQCNLPPGRFSLPNIVELRASENCGCNFAIRCGDSPPPQPLDLTDQNIEDRRRLIDYIRDRAADGPVELWICWAGNEALPELQAISMTVDELQANFDVLADRTFVRFSQA
jgi:hypothetical protein